MVRQVIWTERAQKDRIAIFTYWNNRNESFIYSKKLNELIKESLKLISKHPLIGQLTHKENVRVKILRDYLIIYEVTVGEIIVLSLWDCRQNPKELRRIIE
ncbi:MAG: type II toxin-antitoxin system RelE/ParE family toxin [Bacteroidia bacterium]|nr:type II toxin-antitoxin system RelE/ParE family toxin [Bacteroidia bacterium]